MSINQISYSNTFGDWVTVTNQGISKINSIESDNFTKSNGTLIISSSNTGLIISNNMVVSGNTYLNNVSINGILTYNGKIVANANTTQVGLVQLNDTLISTSNSLAATANSVNTLNKLILTNINNISSAYNKVNSAVQTGFTTINSNGTMIYTIANNETLSFVANSGIKILTNSISKTIDIGVITYDGVDSNSSNLIATANSINNLNNLISTNYSNLTNLISTNYLKLNVSTQTVNSNITIDNSIYSQSSDIILNNNFEDSRIFLNNKNNNKFALLFSNVHNHFAINRLSNIGALLSTPIKIDYSNGDAALNDIWSFADQNLVPAKGHKKFPGGIIIQWGRETTDGSGVTQFNFDIEFPSFCAVVVQNTYQYYGKSVAWHNLTTTGYNCIHNAPDIIVVGYIAIGW